MANRPVQILWLPGDEASVFDFEYRRAVRRDGRLTPKERHIAVLAAACNAAKQSYEWWRCNHRRTCCYCQEIIELCQE